MTTRRILMTALALIAAIATAPGVQADGFKIVMHPDTAVESLTRDQVSEIFLKTRLKLDDGSKLTPVDQSASSGVRKAFTQAVHDWSMDAVMAFWQQQIFSGRGVPPAVKDGDAAVLDFVRATPGAIGYVDAGTAAAGVSVVSVE